MVKEKVENENPESKFRRIAGNRANRILEDIRLLGNCSNKSVYKYNEKQINKIFSTLETELKSIRAMFRTKKKKKIEL